MSLEIIEMKVADLVPYAMNAKQPPSRAHMNISGMRDNGMRRNAPSLKHWLA